MTSLVPRVNNRTSRATKGTLSQNNNKRLFKLWLPFLFGSVRLRCTLFLADIPWSGPGIIDIQGSVLQLSLYIPNSVGWPQRLNCSPWPRQFFTSQATQTQYNLEESYTFLEFNCQVEKQTWTRPDHNRFCVPTLRKTSRRFHLNDAAFLLIKVDYSA